MSSETSRWQTLRSYLACYALYFLVLIPATIGVIVLWRNAVIALIAAVLGRSQANQLVYLASMVFLGMGGFILVMAAEPYMRGGIDRHQLMHRFLRMAVPLAIAAALALLVLTVV